MIDVEVMIAPQEMTFDAHAFLVSGQPMASDLKFQGMRASMSDAGQP